MKIKSYIRNFNTKSVAALTLAGVLLLSFVPLGNSFASAACVSGYCAPYLTISVSTDKSVAAPGDQIIYTITYRNSGSVSATGIVIRDSFINADQGYLDFVSADPAPDSSNNTWIIDGPLAYNESGKITFKIQLKPTLPSNWIGFNNRASIDSNETSPQYSNYATVFAVGTCRLTLDQTVRNVSDSSLFSDSISADSNEEIEFSMELKSTGTNQAVNTRIWDALSNRLDYVAGSTTIDNAPLADGITATNGLTIGNLLPGATKTIKFRAKVNSTASSYVGTSILRNFGYADAQGCGLSSSPTSISVAGKSTSLSVITSTGLTIQNLARNITKKSIYWGEALYVNPGDEIEFLIKVSTTNKEVDSLRIADTLPPKMFYISDSTTIDGNYEPDNIITKNVYLDAVYPNLTREIKFRVKIASQDDFNFYPISLVNKASLWGNDGKEIIDTVKIIVNQPSSSVLGASIVSGQSLSIIKTGRNLSKNQSTYSDSFSANPGDQLEFYVQVTNNGTVDVNNVRVWDNLPQNISIISGSTTIDGANWGGDITGSGLNLATVKKGVTKNIKFKAEVAAANKFTPGSINLTNNVFVEADNISQISDKATVVVNVAKTTGNVTGNTSGEVKGAATVKTGFNYLMMIILSLISAIVAFVPYCILREERFLEIFNDEKTGKFRKSIIGLYFKIKLLFKLKLLKFKK